MRGAGAQSREDVWESVLIPTLVPSLEDEGECPADIAQYVGKFPMDGEGP